MAIQINLEEDDRQMVLLAMAQLAISRPGWNYALSRIAARMDTVVDGKAQMFEQFKDIHQNALRTGGT